MKIKAYFWLLLCIVPTSLFAMEIQIQGDINYLIFMTREQRIERVTRAFRDQIEVILNLRIFNRFRQDMNITEDLKVELSKQNRQFLDDQAQPLLKEVFVKWSDDNLTNILIMLSDDEITKLWNHFEALAFKGSLLFDNSSRDSVAGLFNSNYMRNSYVGSILDVIFPEILQGRSTYLGLDELITEASKFPEALVALNEIKKDYPDLLLSLLETLLCHLNIHEEKLVDHFSNGKNNDSSLWQNTLPAEE
jgi:hypothetical protein